MNVRLVYGIIILIILVSIQYTLNLILREIKSLRISLMHRDDDNDTINRR